MKRTNVNTGTRAEILAELHEYGSDRAKQGNATKAHEFAHAINQVEQGADCVRIRAAVWYVVEDGDSPTDWEIAAAARHDDTAMAG